jgi:glycosyltransferase involved in cell wall biosynthesis
MASLWPSKVATYAEPVPERVLVLAPAYPPAWRFGGPVRSAYATAMDVSHHHEVRVITSAFDLGQRDCLLPVASNSWTTRPEGEVAYLRWNGLRAAVSACRLLLRTRSWQPGLVYLNSFFHPVFSILPQMLARIGLWRNSPIIVLAVRGEMGAAALRRRARKKRAYLLLYRLLRMDRGVVWQASSPAEETDIRAVFGERAAIVVRRNDTVLPPPDVSTLTRRRSGPLHTVFVGRMHPHKGLERLLRGLTVINGSPSLSIDIIGPEQEMDHVRSCRALAERMPPGIKVSFLGPKPPPEVRDALRDADLLLMPTDGENFGQVIAESLSVATPVMAMDVTPWTRTLRNGGGVVVEGESPTCWAEAIEAYAMLDLAEVERRRRLASSAYAEWCMAQPDQDLVTMVLASCRQRSHSRRTFDPSSCGSSP